jgi:hypothetical protein
MLPRSIRPRLEALARRFPVVTVTGPRQSGKTTLCRATFPRKRYVSLEAVDAREHARDDPRGFLDGLRDGAILDEVQRAPDLLSYLQGEVDERPAPGRFVLTGSANLLLLQSISQSLAGRSAFLQLLPLGLDEIRHAKTPPGDLWTVIWRGGYPVLFDRELDPPDWLDAYVTAYVERDVRQILNVGDLISFQTFLRLAASRSAQLVALSALGADAGVTHNTAKAWLSVLETSFLVFRLPAFHANLGKRLVKTPKLHFVDTGLLCFLLGIREPAQLAAHPLRGPIFETWVVSEILKSRLNAGLPPSLAFFRDRKGLEIDAIVEGAGTLLAVEAKSGRTIAADFTRSLESFEAQMEGVRPLRRIRSFLVHGGLDEGRRRGVTLLPWNAVDQGPWAKP